MQNKEILHHPFNWGRGICYIAQRRDFEWYLYMFCGKILLLKRFILALDNVSLQFNLIFCSRKGHSKILLGTAEFPVPGHWHQGLPRCVIPAGVIAWGWVEGQVVSEDGREGSKQAAAALCID